MARPLKDKLPDWILDLTAGKDIERANTNIEHLTARLFDQYEPSLGPNAKFMERLDKWLNNLPDEQEQQLLFRLVPHIFFLGPRELEILYRAAFNNSISTWLIEQSNLMLDDPHLGDRLNATCRRTWFCPITDSMRINAFYHLNNIAGVDFRPDWRSLSQLGDTTKIVQFLAQNKIEQIVLLEDFVGSGSQIHDAVRFAATLPTRLPLLVVPLVLCPEGATMLDHFAAAFTHVQYAPVVTLNAHDFLTDVANPGEPALFDAIRPLLTTHYPQLLKGLSAMERKKMYGPYGFRRTGGLLVMWTNCPNNTLPVIHCKSEVWAPLFPRASRI